MLLPQNQPEPVSPCVLLAAVMACFFDRDPLSQNVLARSHGRVEAAIVLIKVLLVGGCA